MKQIRKALCVHLAIFIFLCSGCGLFGDQQYVCNVENVKSVQIVHLNGIVEGEYRFDYTMLSEIADQAGFINRLTTMKHKVNWGEPSALEEGIIVIRIEFLNGDYDLIYHNAQSKHRSGTNYGGYFFFDEEQFNSLISDYINE